MQRGKVPIVVGGTGFYLRWFVHGKPRTPASTAESAKQVQAFLEQVCSLLDSAFVSLLLMGFLPATEAFNVTFLNSRGQCCNSSPFQLPVTMTAGLGRGGRAERRCLDCGGAVGGWQSQSGSTGRRAVSREVCRTLQAMSSCAHTLSVLLRKFIILE